MEQSLLANAQAGLSANVVIPFIPVVAVLIGALIALWRRPGAGLSSAIQHFAAGVVFAAAAAEILPQVKHEGAIVPTAIGGILGVATMLAIKKLEEHWKGPMGMLPAIGIDLFVDGVVLGLAFLAGEKAGFLLAFLQRMNDRECLAGNNWEVRSIFRSGSPRHRRAQSYSHGKYLQP